MEIKFADDHCMIRIVAGFVAWQAAATIEQFKEKSEALLALGVLSQRAKERSLRPLRWYTDARDGLCPEAK